MLLARTAIRPTEWADVPESRFITPSSTPDDNRRDDPTPSSGEVSRASGELGLERAPIPFGPPLCVPVVERDQ